MNNYVAINETGSIYQTMNGNNMKVSDREVFQNFTPVENSDLIYQLNPVQGYSIDDTQPQKDLKYVIFATEVRNYFPSLTESVVLDATNLRIDKNGNTMSRLEFVDYVQFIPLMIAEMKNLKNQISQLQATINQMNSTPIEE
jgi:hypothetical protein